MDYEKIIGSIERDLKLSIHFTDYDFEQILNIKCPRPENPTFLIGEYFNLLNNLKAFLINKPSKEMIDLFILESLKNLDSSKYLKEEFELLILKFNRFNHFVLRSSSAKEYFDKIKDKLVYNSPTMKN